MVDVDYSSVQADSRPVLAGWIWGSALLSISNV